MKKILTAKKSKKMSRPGHGKMGLLGGSFDPLHLGHIRLVEEVKKHFQLKILKILPAFQNPLKPHPPEAASPLRIKWLKTVFKNYPGVEVEDWEIKNKTVYTVQTLRHFSKTYKNIYFIMGMDEFLELPRWHQFEELLKKVHFIVCSRKGYPVARHPIPKALQLFLKARDSKKISLKTGKKYLLSEFKKKQFHFLLRSTEICGQRECRLPSAARGRASEYSKAGPVPVPQCGHPFHDAVLPAGLTGEKSF